MMDRNIKGAAFSCIPPPTLLRQRKVVDHAREEEEGRQEVPREDQEVGRQEEGEEVRKCL
ncbi:MAG: hypothetical protein ABW321_27325 [Polyangiales bacterium]